MLMIKYIYCSVNKYYLYHSFPFDYTDFSESSVISVSMIISLSPEYGNREVSGQSQKKHLVKPKLCSSETEPEITVLSHLFC